MREGEKERRRDGEKERRREGEKERRREVREGEKERERVGMRKREWRKRENETKAFVMVKHWRGKPYDVTALLFCLAPSQKKYFLFF
jgi:hypothetical protein